MDQGILSLAWGRAIVDSLVGGGVGHFCVSPGSRSSPLAVAVAEQGAVTTSVHIDERSAGYFGIGVARASGRPAVLVCTSGTAAANYLPAIVEAHYSRVPLVVLTADRPPELRDTGAPQTIEQAKLYGAYTRWSAELISPRADAGAFRYLRSVCHRAAAVAVGTVPGPVHVNVPLVEPLLPGREAQGVPDEGPDSWGAGTAPSVPPVVPRPAEATMVELAAAVAAEPRGLIVAGRTAGGPGYAEAVADLSRVAGYPILAESVGHVRFGRHDRTLALSAYEAVLRAERWSAAHAPRLVLHLGASPTWRHVAEFVGQAGAMHFHIDPWQSWDDPTRVSTMHLAAPPAAVCRDLADRLAGPTLGPSVEERHGAGSPWPSAWLRAERLARASFSRLADERSGHASGVAWLFRSLAEWLPDGALVFAGNSMAVRDLDAFSHSAPVAARVIANRGASGIDGCVSTGLGAALASTGPTLVVVGDVAFAHDVGALHSAHEAGMQAKIVVIDDQGGGIFDYLPPAGLDEDVYARYFMTPPRLSIGDACTAFGVPHLRVNDTSTLSRSLTEADWGGLQVLALPVDRDVNTAFHRDYWSSVVAALDA